MLEYHSKTSNPNNYISCLTFYLKAVLGIDQEMGIQECRQNVFPVSMTIIVFHQMVLEGELTGNYQGDIAVDDISVYTGNCVEHQGKNINVIKKFKLI